MTKARIVQSVNAAEQRLIEARNWCLHGMTDLALEEICEITAFYERAGLKDRAKACSETIDRLLYQNNWSEYLEILQNLALGPNEWKDSIFEHCRR